MTFAEALKFKSANIKNKKPGVQIRLYIVPANVDFEEYFNSYSLNIDVKSKYSGHDDYVIYGIWSIGRSVFYKKIT